MELLLQLAAPITLYDNYPVIVQQRSLPAQFVCFALSVSGHIVVTRVSCCVVMQRKHLHTRSTGVG